MRRRGEGGVRKVERFGGRSELEREKYNERESGSAMTGNKLERESTGGREKNQKIERER